MSASAPLISGGVSAYGFAGGSKGALLATSPVSSLGEYQLVVPASSGVILIEATGCYTEKAIPWGSSSNRYPQVGNAIFASVCSSTPALSAGVLVSASATSQAAHITPYTHAAVGLAEYLVRIGSAPQAALADANARLSSWVGADILTTRPAEPSRAIVLSDSSKYGALLAGVSSWVLNSATGFGVFGSGGLTSLDFAAAMRSDLAQDGVLNGVGRDASGQPVSLTVGVASMSTGQYRHQLALNATIRLRAETEGVVGATPAEQARILDFLPALVAYNDSSSATNTLVDGTAVVALDEGGPVVVIGTPLPGGSLTGNQGMAGIVRDIVGIPSLNTVMLIDGVQYAQFADQYIPNHFINTTVFAAGAHILTIRSTNNLGRVSSASVNVTFY